MSISENLENIKKAIPKDVFLVAVSKTKTVDVLMNAYDSGQRIFGENKIQEMVTKHEDMPNDVEWHMIGHVQRNKVKYIAPFVSLIHAVDSLKLLQEIDRRAKLNNRVIDCLLQIKIAEEDSKFGLDEDAALMILNSDELKILSNVRIKGIMGMATFTKDKDQLQREFGRLNRFYKNNKDSYHFTKLSMGMSDDYQIAIENGSTMIRVGSAIFGSRN